MGRVPALLQPGSPGRKQETPSKRGASAQGLVGVVHKDTYDHGIDQTHR